MELQMAPLDDEDKSVGVHTPPATAVGAAVEDSSSPDAAFIDALRRLVRSEANQPPLPPKVPPARIRILQAVILLVVVLDVVLLYGQFQEWFENPLFKFALQALPWLLGATAFAYSDSVRTWILEQCKQPFVGVIAAFLALPLLLIREPVFSLVATTPFDGVMVTADNPADRLAFRFVDATHVRITVPDLLQSYRIKVTDQDQNRHPLEFQQNLGRFRIIEGTFAQLPGLKQLFPGFSIHLVPVYRVIAVPAKSDAWVIAEGHLDKGFMDAVSQLTESRCDEFMPSAPGLNAIRCLVPPGRIGSILLPPGTFSVAREGCKQGVMVLTIPKHDNDPLKMEDLCPQ
jgi:hypothetical protein